MTSSAKNAPSGEDGTSAKEGISTREVMVDEDGGDAPAATTPGDEGGGGVDAPAASLSPASARVPSREGATAETNNTQGGDVDVDVKGGATDALTEDSVSVSVSGSTSPPLAATATTDATGGRGDRDGDGGTAGGGGGGEGGGVPAVPTASAAVLDHTSKRVLVYNVLKFMRKREQDKLLSSWTAGNSDIRIRQAKKPQNTPWMRVTLEEESMVQPFIDAVHASNNDDDDGGENGGKKRRRGGPYSARRVVDGDGGRDDDGGDGRKRRRGDRGRGDEGGGGADDDDNDERNRGGRRGGDKPPSPSSSAKTPDQVRDAIVPLWRVPYEEQLTMKQKDMVRRCALVIKKEMKKIFRKREQEAKRNPKHVKRVPVYSWVNSDVPIEVSPIIPSPSTAEYRNKVELTFGYAYEGAARVDEKPDVAEEEGGAAAPGNAPPASDDDIAADGGSPSATSPPTGGGDEENDHDGGDDDDDGADKILKYPAVGFLASGWSGGVSAPHHCINTPWEVCGIADVITDKFLSTSPLPPYDTRTHTGVWRTVTVRLSRRTGRCMVVVQHAPPSGGAGAGVDGADDYSKQFEAERDRLVRLLTEGPIPRPKARDLGTDDDGGTGDDAGSCGGNEASGDAGGGGGGCPEESGGTPTAAATAAGAVAGDDACNSTPLRVTSIFFQEFDGLSLPKPEHPVQHAYGETSLEERLGGCKFLVSPGAFFQVNTEGAEVLYDVVVKKLREAGTAPGADEADAKSDALLFDVCCGTGTIGITCMKANVAGRVVGVDISEPAISDARNNAGRNGFPPSGEATRFVASRAESVLARELANVSPSVKDGKNGRQAFAVVDPARDGLHADVVRALKANEMIQRLIYVSCNPTGTLPRDAAMLCSPQTKKYPGLPFKPTSAQPVDMFPHTPHCEMVMTFDRMSEDEYVSGDQS